MTLGRQPGERGASMVEAAISTLLLFTLLFAVIEGGYLLRDYNIVSDAASDGARVAALLGPDSEADYEIVKAVREATGSMPPEWVKRIVIFEATGNGSADSQISAACRNGTAVNGRCSVYNDPYEAFLAVQDGDVSYFTCPGGESCAWAPAQRQDGPSVNDIDYVGVYLEVDRAYLTGMFGSTLTLDDASVSRIEVGDLIP